MGTITSSNENIVRKDEGTLALRQYKIGDLAQGGIVFWVDETGEHGLICSPNDQESAHGVWSAGSEVTGVTGGTVDGESG